MKDEAFELLAQINLGMDPKPALEARWASALKTVTWIEQTDQGLKLTVAGREALMTFRTDRRKPCEA